MVSSPQISSSRHTNRGYLPVREFIEHERQISASAKKIELANKTNKKLAKL